jgi:hypothetical protein
VISACDDVETHGVRLRRSGDCGAGKSCKSCKFCENRGSDTGRKLKKTTKIEVCFAGKIMAVMMIWG